MAVQERESAGPAPTAQVQPEASVPPLLLADITRRPKVTVSWPTRDGQTVTLEGVRAYRSSGDKSPLGRNIEAYVALGGTRIDRGQGHRDGAIVQVGLYKKDAGKPFFDAVAEGATVRIAMSGVKMNQPARPNPGTGLMHLRYMVSDLEACGIDSTGRNLYVTQDPDDRLKQMVLPTSGRFGGLDGREGNGRVTTRIEEDGSITIEFEFPYHLLRHTLDPYQRTTPGGFFEPQHFHVEMELLPVVEEKGEAR